VLTKLGLQDFRFKVGHTGILRGILDQEGLDEAKQDRVRQLLDKKLWDDALKAARKAGASQNCLTVLENLLETRNEEVFKVLENVKETVQDYEVAVAAVDNLWKILELVKDSGAKLKLIVEAVFARGLEYYTGIIFESYIPGLDIALGGGGRYDKLIQLFGGEPIPAVGVAQGIDRIVLALTKQNASQKTAKERSVVVISIKDESMAKALELAAMLRNSGLPVEVAVMGRSIRRALTDADRRGAGYAVIVGPKELEEKKVVLKDMNKGEQRIVPISNLTEEILAGLK
jgi:histidyl-tRNA synthetase